ncbi:putative Bet v I/Major latex protein [Helianthus annuus]|uniref:Bet v I/Major latex protein n=1 Tax=Helianthus annuus TaxID=4232 RepID=A0A9K3IC68_HELAN|nr:putative Bet v I/Major latex protein [Helianthus annuus]KAJ0537700.1 putative Bet v I/Major latex protein [Helianthus annuus]KAJ0552282.1 putative Bet v I/Major latex protein [Helianthus annuus]KAJ0717979.1 putative Bet v I/Major latex protein [Helianthus annuus]KAJ0896373.1 putative Bet v I/Major latex protein [Helianthus annuus]
MTLSGTLVKQVTIKSDGDVFHETFRYRTHHISKMRPDNIKGVELHDGERGIVGSILVWNFFHGKSRLLSVTKFSDKEFIESPLFCSAI